jgi:TatD DNase family protein
MRLIDTHSHIHDAEFDADRDATIDRAREAGVAVMLTLGVDAANSRLAIALAERHECVLAAAGVHPHDAAAATDADLDALEELAQHPRIAVVGEIGLDFYRNLSPRDRQMIVMRRQLDTARRVGKPIAVHAREAHEEMLPLLTAWSRDMGGRLPDGRPLGIMHYFSEDAAMARSYIELGFMISIHTSVTHPKATQLAEVAREIPLDHLVIETDSPYGAPQTYRGKRNEPAYVAEAAAKIAELKGITLDEVAEATTRNAERLLGIASFSTANGTRGAGVPPARGAGFRPADTVASASARSRP